MQIDPYGSEDCRVPHWVIQTSYSSEEERLVKQVTIKKETPQNKNTTY